MAKFRATVKPTSRPRAATSTAVHGHDSIHETAQQAAEAPLRRTDADDTWSRPTNLTAPPDRPGFKQRWIRVRIGEKADTKRVSRALREGWRPRPPDSVPGDFTPETIQLEGIGSVISVDDMVLMEMPIKKFRAKQRYYAEKKARQMDSVNEDLLKTQAEGGLPISRRQKARVTVGRSRARTVESD